MPDPLQELSIQQIRVLACLMEKHLATPKNYPLSYNSLMLACNQKSNRARVMDLTEGQVAHTVSELSELDFARIDYGERANRVSHRAPAVLKINRQQQAVLAILMLREPLTLNDIKSRTERMVGFEDMTAVKAVVDELVNRQPPLLVMLPRGNGRREDRYTHLLGGAPDIELLEAARPVAKSGNHGDKLAELEARIEKLEHALGIGAQTP